ncbi:hypothetical protein BpHYR1_018312, partial [Brachionus plicatilis]
MSKYFASYLIFKRSFRIIKEITLDREINSYFICLISRFSVSIFNWIEISGNSGEQGFHHLTRPEIWSSVIKELLILMFTPKRFLKFRKKFPPMTTILTKCKHSHGLIGASCLHFTVNYVVLLAFAT